ncbi:MAG: T9SS type A sorting domain-containing protein [Bacteroidales bacterium]|nr:T9SS type A sorting domain-containing protein [Bacteroidales bacterium]
MKKEFLVLTTALFLMMGLRSQTPLNTAIDFTVTDITGVEHNLFTYLDAGKYVCIDFFFVNCGPCQVFAPKFQQTFEHFGCNSSNVIFLSISSQDNMVAVQNYAASHNYTYPMVPNTWGVTTTYQIGAYPTIILIAPNRQIVEKDIWPVNTAQVLIDKLLPYGAIPQSCSAVGVNELSDFSFSVTPNPFRDQIKIEVDSFVNVEIYDLMGKKLDSFTVNQLLNYNSSSLKPGIYMIKAFSSEGKIVASQKLQKF